MIVIYIIQSEIDGTYYTGMASDLEKRLKEHNSGKSKYTKSKKPWKLVYQEFANDWESGRRREKYLKTTAGKNWALKNKEKRFFILARGVPCLQVADKQGFFPTVYQIKPPNSNV